MRGEVDELPVLDRGEIDALVVECHPTLRTFGDQFAADMGLTRLAHLPPAQRRRDPGGRSITSA